MKKIVLFFFLFSILTVSISCQTQQWSSKIDATKEFDNGSGITFPSLNEQLTANLELLGKLWGFLKYHHPQVGKGNYNWDYELFRLLPSYLEAENIEERDKTLFNWIVQYGEIPVCTTCKETPADAYLKPDLSWVEKSNMNSDLKEKIYEIYANRHQGMHHYISMGNPPMPIFINENQYLNMPYPDAGFRLLALYRYWNMIRYFFPYTYMTDKNWDDVFTEYIPLFILAKNGLEYQFLVTQIIGDVNDTHAKLYNSREMIRHKGINIAPFEVRFIEQRWVVTTDTHPWIVTTPFQVISDIKIGDIITHINGRSVESIIDSVRIYYPASNEAARLRDIARDLLRSQHNTIHIRYISSGQEKQKEQRLYPISSSVMTDEILKQEEKCYKFMDGNIGYITLATIKREDVSVIKELFGDTKGIIIDIRNYPLTYVVHLLGSYFVSESTPFVKITKGNPNNPGEFTFSEPTYLRSSSDTYQGKLVVLVNEYTQSQAEYTAMALRAGNNTTVVGSTTAGADGDISVIYLPGGLMTVISGIGIYYPDGTPTQRIGIVPDVWLEPTLNGIIQGRDELLEKAMEIIQKQ